MQVQDIMSQGVRTVSPSTTLLEVSSLMCLYRLSGLPVVEGDVSHDRIMRDAVP